MTKIVACIDGSHAAPAVCDASAWASQRLGARLRILHVLDRSEYPTKSDLAGNIGLGSREHIRERLAELDHQRSKLALEEGKVMLEEARERVVADGVEDVETLQRHGHLVDTLQDLENDTRVLVMGRQGEAHDSNTPAIGSNLETVIRSIHRPILVALPGFEPPERIMVAYDGSTTAKKVVEMVARSDLFKGLDCHLVMAGSESPKHHEQLAEARTKLEKAGLEVSASLVSGDVVPVLQEYEQKHDIDLVVMGAYGHSRIREFLVGSTTTQMIRKSTIPMLLLR